MEDLKPGDTVQLKSGGEFMTIEWIDEFQAGCVWFESKKVHNHVFNVVVLVKATPGFGLG